MVCLKIHLLESCKCIQIASCFKVKSFLANWLQRNGQEHKAQRLKCLKILIKEPNTSLSENPINEERLPESKGLAALLMLCKRSHWNGYLIATPWFQTKVAQLGLLLVAFICCPCPWVLYQWVFPPQNSSSEVSLHMDGGSGNERAGWKVSSKDVFCAWSPRCLFLWQRIGNNGPKTRAHALKLGMLSIYVCALFLIQSWFSVLMCEQGTETSRLLLQRFLNT